MRFLYQYQSMKTTPDLQIRLLIHQNTQLVNQIQNYRRQNQELSRKNQYFNNWVQNLSEVFLAISSTWKVIINSEETLYALVNKKNDAASKGLISKYMAHFKTFDEIIDCLGEKLTNEGHSDAAAIDAKTRIGAFFNNYLLFFKEFSEAYFRHNDEYAVFLAQKKEQSGVQMNMKQIMTRQLEHRQKIKDIEPIVAQIKDSLTAYQSQSQHKLLDGVITKKEQQIQRLRITSQRQARRLAHLTDYSPNNVQYVLENESEFECYCGGVKLEYFSAAWSEAMKAKETSGPSEMVQEERENMQAKIQQCQQLQVQKDLLLQRNAQLQTKMQKVKLQNRLTDDQVLQSSVYMHLKMQFSDLMAYTNEILGRLNKQHEYLNQLERLRHQEMEELQKKYMQKHPISRPVVQEPQPIPQDNTLMTRFKSDILKQLNDVKQLYVRISAQSHQREDKLSSSRETIRQLHKDNQDLHRKLQDLQERNIKSVEAMQYRHKHFNEVEKAINEMMSSRPPSEETNKLKKTWGEYVEYVKTRDKKIKAMEEHIRRKDKEIAQKAKIEEVLKNALAQTEAVYVETKQKLDGFIESVGKIEKDISNFSEESYRAKIEAEQEKNFMAIRLRNEIEVKQQLQERIQSFERIETQMLSGQRKQGQLEQRFKQFQEGEREKMNQMALDIKEGEEARKRLQELIEEKQRVIERLSEDKERKNLQMNKMRLRVKAIEEKNQFQVVRMELQTYKSKVMCRCGAERQREIALKTCPHLFCRKCIEDTTTHRNRKCPICSTRFTKSDIYEIVWA